MSNKLYRREEGKQLEVYPEDFTEELQLQKLIAENPQLLVRDTDPADLKIYLVDREFVVRDPSEHYMYLDHLMLDSNGIPIIVETKRKNNEELRRAVVAQVIDYASQLSSIPINRIQEKFINTNPNLALSSSSTDWWSNVENNLKAEKFKLVIVADSIPPTLQSVIQFLDRNFENIDVYGVVLTQYKSENVSLLMTDMVNNPTARPKPRFRSPWTIPEVRERIRAIHGDDAVAAFSSIVDFWRSFPESKIIGGTGAKYSTLHFSIRKTLVFDIWEFSPFRIYIYPNDNLSLDDLSLLFKDALDAGVVRPCEAMLAVDFDSLLSPERTELLIKCLGSIFP